ncbi:hypothetical protein [Streptomyces brasiliensis]|uniref:Uncharacterized protein n=1 Tax=Streptomyces brasiliensis TaxID=1954 RepID=A0A917KM70_9ACTN|nr:hypothetical protein [Streptomyces brasiliensis]GGJ20388.1 hypothetical protein GCM10010121_034190 [Streptomyces brasiliensis]
MTGGQRHWNEDAQRWEDGAEPRRRAAPTQPPPARPDFTPGAVDVKGADGDVARHGPAAGSTVADGGTVAGRSTGTVADGGAAGVWPPSEPLVGGPGGPSLGEWPDGAGGPVSGGWPGVWPPVGQPPASVPRGGLNRRLVWSVLVGAAVAGVAVSLVLTLVVGKGDDMPDNRPGAASASESPSPSQQPTESPTDTASPSASTPELPAGYASYDDEEGFRIAFPEGWKRSAFDSSYGIAVVNYRSPDKEHRLQVYRVSEGSPDASFELYLSDRTGKPAGFRKLALQNLDDGGFTGSRLEYLAGTLKGEPDVGTWHVYDERFVAADGGIYAIAAYGPDSDGRDDELELLTTALNWFCPPSTTCDADPALD